MLLAVVIVPEPLVVDHKVVRRATLLHHLLVLRLRHRGEDVTLVLHLDLIRAPNASARRLHLLQTVGNASIARRASAASTGGGHFGSSEPTQTLVASSL
jgi:hypothetical protein